MHVEENVHVQESLMSGRNSIYIQAMEFYERKAREISLQN